MAGAEPLAHPPGRVTAPRSHAGRQQAGSRLPRRGGTAGHGHAAVPPAPEPAPAFPGSTVRFRQTSARARFNNPSDMARRGGLLTFWLQAVRAGNGPGHG